MLDTHTVAPRPRGSLAKALGIALAAVLSVPCLAQPLAPAAHLTVRGTFAENAAKTARDLSGIACLAPGADGARECLVINDESRAAQRATLAGTTLTAGPMVQLIGNNLPVGALGTRPEIICAGGPGNFGEFDGEGVTFAPGPAATGGTYYVVGSHGCSRRNDRARLSSFLLARIPVGHDGELGATELTWRLSGALRSSHDLAPAFGSSLNQANGLNIEGIAAVGPDLLFGMRAPVVPVPGAQVPAEAGLTFIARVSASALFAPGSSGEAIAHVRRIQLGANAGIRDMATLPDGRLLVLSGPAQEQTDVPFALWVFDLGQNSDDRPTRSAVLQDVLDGGERAKAEATAVLDVVGGEARILILFDGIENGGPREYRVRL